MALALTPPHAGGAHLPGHARLAPALGSLLALAVCGLGIVDVALPAMRAAAEVAVVGGPVTVQLDGRISTAGLPAAAAVSELRVRNVGGSPLQWSVRPTVDGPGALALVVEAWLPTAGGCAAPTTVLGPSTWSAEALQPGASAAVCVRVRTTGRGTGPATPRLTVAARGL